MKKLLTLIILVAFMGKNIFAAEVETNLEIEKKVDGTVKIIEITNAQVKNQINVLKEFEQKIILFGNNIEEVEKARLDKSKLKEMSATTLINKVVQLFDSREKIEKLRIDLKVRSFILKEFLELKSKITDIVTYQIWNKTVEYRINELQEKFKEVHLLSTLF
jgi:hypothetical protein